jgi:hypothetical protein
LSTDWTCLPGSGDGVEDSGVDGFAEPSPAGELSIADPEVSDPAVFNPKLSDPEVFNPEVSDLGAGA